MNKHDFLKKLSLDELNLVDDITHSDILAEKNIREEQIGLCKFKVGNCLKKVHDNGDIYLYKIDEINRDRITCTEIQFISDCGFECYYGMYHSLVYMINAESISKKTFDFVKSLYDEYDNTLNSINKEYYNKVKSIVTTRGEITQIL